MGSSRETASPTPHRPPPLRIHKDSHTIQKPTAAAASCSSAPATTNLSSAQQQRHPVIIYTQSPKVIRTKPHNFMALVQKLTGMNPEDAPKEAAPAAGGEAPHPAKPRQEAAAAAAATSRPRPVARRELIPPSSCTPNGNPTLLGGVPMLPAMSSMAFDVPFFPDMPMFPTTSSTSDLFYPQRQLYTGGAGGGAMSPTSSMMDAMWSTYREY